MLSLKIVPTLSIGLRILTEHRLYYLLHLLIHATRDRIERLTYYRDPRHKSNHIDIVNCGSSTYMVFMLYNILFLEVRSALSRHIQKTLKNQYIIVVIMC